MSVVGVVFLCAVSVGCGTAVASARWPSHGVGPPSGAVKRVARWLIRHPRLLSAVERHADARVAAGLALGMFLVVALGGLAVVGALLALLEGGSQLADLDRALANWGAEHATRHDVDTMLFFTRFGATELVVLVALVIVAVQWRRNGSAVLAYLFTVIAGITLILNGLKWLVDRDRPDVRPLAHFAASSFPSGHAATAAAAWAAFALVLGLRQPHAAQALLTGAATAIATATAGSRVFLGVHWLSDVVAGVALGWAWFAVTTIAFGGRLLRFGTPIEAAERADSLRG